VDQSRLEFLAFEAAEAGVEPVEYRSG